MLQGTLPVPPWSAPGHTWQCGDRPGHLPETSSAIHAQGLAQILGRKRVALMAASQSRGLFL